MLFVSGFIAFSHAQTDTVFWFAAPDLEISHQQTPIRFCFTTYDQPTTITLSQPANSGFAPIVFSVPADSFHVLDVSSFVDIIETKPHNTVVNTGILISSAAPISCYYESVGNNSEIYTLKGRNALGTDFLVPMQTLLNNNYYSSTSSIEIVATEDSTVVEITAPVAMSGGIAADSTVTILLHRGQSYKVQANSTSGSEHLQNTRIRSNKPIAVNFSDDSVYAAGCFDLLGDQLVPASMMGTRYVALRNNSDYERVFIYPLENQTTVTVNGVELQTIHDGEGISYALPYNSMANLIEADRPVVVLQMTAIGCEVGGTVLPQFECTGSHKISHLRPGSSAAVVTLLVGSEHVANFLFNGSPEVITADDFAPVPTDSSLSYCVKDVSAYTLPGSVMTIQNTSGRFQMGVLDGTPGGDCSYGYFSDYNSASYVRFAMDTVFCNGADIVFGYNASNISGVMLTCPDGSQLTEPPFVIPHADSSFTGLYRIEGVDTSACFLAFADSIYLRVADSDSVHDTVKVAVPANSLPYSWDGILYHTPGTYTRQFVSSSGCDSTVVLALSTLPFEVTVTVGSDTVCEGESTTLQASAGPVAYVPPVAVGDILCTDGSTVKPDAFVQSGKTAMGVVFHVDTTGAHGWAVHLHDQSGAIAWGTIDTDVPGVSNYDNFHDNGLFPDFDGYANTQALRAAGDASAYPAAYAVDFPNGWYLPDIGQLDILISEMAVLNPALLIAGGTPFPTNSSWYYWSSTEAASLNPGYAWFVCSDGLVDYTNKLWHHHPPFDDTVEGDMRVRSIRNF